MGERMMCLPIFVKIRMKFLGVREVGKDECVKVLNGDRTRVHSTNAL